MITQLYNYCTSLYRYISYSLTIKIYPLKNLFQSYHTCFYSEVNEVFDQKILRMWFGH
jgi:hypothetical protein